MEQLPIVDVLRQRVWMIVLLTFVAALAGYGSSYLVTERYTASALVLVRPQQPIQTDERNINKNLYDFPVTQSMSVETPSKTYIEIIKSGALIERVVRTLDLERMTDKSGGFLFRYLSPEWSEKLLRYKDDLLQAYKDLIAILMYGRLIPNDPFANSVREVKDNISLKSIEDTFVFQLDYAGRNPQMAADVANMMAKSFIDFMEQIRLSDARYVKDHLKTKLDQSRQDLASARENLESPKSRATLRDLKLQELDVEAAETAYQTTVKDFKEAENNLLYPLPEVRLVSEALPPNLPSSPIRIKIAAVSLLGGLFVGISLAFFLEFRNRRVRGIAEVENFIGIKVIATIPRISRRRWRAYGLQ